MNFDTIDRHIQELTAIKNYDMVVAAGEKVLEENDKLKKKIEELEKKTYADMLNEIDQIIREMLKEEPSLSKEVIESGILERIEELVAIHHFRRSNIPLIVEGVIDMVSERLAPVEKNEDAK